MTFRYSIFSPGIDLVSSSDGLMDLSDVWEYDLDVLHLVDGVMHLAEEGSINLELNLHFLLHVMLQCQVLATSKSKRDQSICTLDKIIQVRWHQINAR